MDFILRYRWPRCYWSCFLVFLPLHSGSLRFVALWDKMFPVTYIITWMSARGTVPSEIQRVWIHAPHSRAFPVLPNFWGANVLTITRSPCSCLCRERAFPLHPVVYFFFYPHFGFYSNPMSIRPFLSFPPESTRFLLVYLLVNITEGF